MILLSFEVLFLEFSDVSNKEKANLNIFYYRVVKGGGSKGMSQGRGFPNVP